MSTTLSTLSALFTTGSFPSASLPPAPLSASPVNETDIIWIKNPRGKTYYKSQYLGRGASAKVYEVDEVLLNVNESVDGSGATAKVIGKYACKIIDKPKQKSHYFAYMSPSRSATDIQNMNIDFNERIHNEIRIHREIEKNRSIYANISGGTGSRYIVNFIDNFEDRNFIYIIFELCQKSLQDLINMNYFTAEHSAGPVGPVPPGKMEKSYSDVEDDISITRSSQNSNESDSCNFNDIIDTEKIETENGNPVTRGMKAKYYFLQLMSGVDYLHSMDIIHGDLKPQNLLITFTGCDGTGLTGTIKITDFGLAIHSGERLLGYGTANFIAPEILTHAIHKKYQEKIDIWACGIILYNMMFKGFPFDPVTGRPGQSDGTVAKDSKNRKVNKTTSREDLFANIVKCDLQTPAATITSPFAPSEYDDLILLSIIKKILQRDPIDRPTAQEILGFLAPF